MPELRQDPVAKHWVVIATERSKRPSDFPVYREPRRGADKCPFCQGREEQTPPEIWAYRKEGTFPNTPGWWVRVVPNKFAALQIEGSLQRQRHGLYERMDGVGAHEVIIETPEHDKELQHLPRKQVAEILRIWRDRCQDLRKDRRIKYIQIFKNTGAVAGASLEHTHSQLIATPLVPAVFEEEIAGINEYRRATGRCIYCDMAEEELKGGERLVEASRHFAAFCPYAARFPFETWIVPRRHSWDFGAITEEEIEDLAGLLKSAVSRLAVALHSPPYNLILHSAPVNEGGVESYHWHIEILPRLTTVAGFEWGTGYYINPTPPEVAAASLREAVTEAEASVH